MSLEDVRNAAKLEGKQESILILLERLGEVTNSIKKCIMSEVKEEILSNMIKYASSVTSFADFEERFLKS